MRHMHSIHSRGVVAPAALRFAARRGAKRRDAWRPIALFWRQKRKGLERERATRLALKTGAAWLAQFHLHFVRRENDCAPRHTTRGLSPVASIHQTRVVMEHRMTIIQSRMYLAQPPRAQSTIQVSSLRHAQSDLGTKLQTTAQYPNSARRPIIPATTTLRHAQSDLGTKLQATPQYPKSARQSIAPAPTTWGAVRAPSTNLGQTRLRVHPGISVDEKDQTFQSVQTYTMEPHLFRSRSAVMRHLAPPRSQESTPARLYFQPQKLVWRRVTQPTAENAGNRRQWDLDALEEESHGRSFTGKDAAFGMSRSSEHAPATPVIKIDSALMDRMTDDVIRRLERRARIERARQGL